MDFDSEELNRMKIYDVKELPQMTIMFNTVPKEKLKTEGGRFITK